MSDTLPPRIIRWSLFLAAYDYTILCYKPGSSLTNANVMSRLPLPEEVDDSPMQGSIIALMDHLEDCPVSARAVQVMQRG